jgi:hypothetical protein
VGVTVTLAAVAVRVGVVDIGVGVVETMGVVEIIGVGVRVGVDVPCPNAVVAKPINAAKHNTRRHIFDGVMIFFSFPPSRSPLARNQKTWRPRPAALRCGGLLFKSAAIPKALDGRVLSPGRL